MANSFIHTLVATDICSGWTESLPFLVREQSLVVEGLNALFQQISFPVLGINSDNDGTFINNTLLKFCEERKIEFTRSRAYQKNDQAWVEQKNGVIICRIVGYERVSGIISGQILVHLYQSVRLYVNYFQPSFKLRKKRRNGAKVTRIYYKPLTPCERLLRHPEVDGETREKLRIQRMKIDPVELLYRIREGQAALASLGSENDSGEGPRGRSRSISFFLNCLNCGITEKFVQHIVLNLLSAGIGEQGKIPLKRFGLTFFAGYKKILILLQRRFLKVFSVNTQAHFRTVSSELFRDVFDNGGKSWQGNLYMFA
jgi:hypothetical protein